MTLLLLLPLLMFHAAEPVPTPTLERWLDETRRLESADGHKLFGDKRHGVYHSLGPYMIQRRPWYAFGGSRPWRIHAHREAEARAVAARILQACARKCVREHRPVTFENARYFYQHGGWDALQKKSGSTKIGEPRRVQKHPGGSKRSSL
jgi:hypothetical protein